MKFLFKYVISVVSSKTLLSLVNRGNRIAVHGSRMIEIVKCFVTVKTTDNNCYKINSSVETETCIESSVIL